MADCPVCKGGIKNGAKICRHCGTPIKWKRYWILNLFLAIVCLAAAMVFPLFILGTPYFLLMPFVNPKPKERK